MSTFSNSTKKKNNSLTIRKNFVSKKNFCSSTNNKNHRTNTEKEKCKNKNIDSSKLNLPKNNDESKLNLIQSSTSVEKNINSHLFVDIEKDEIYTGDNNFGKSSPIEKSSKSSHGEKEFGPPPGFKSKSSHLPNDKSSFEQTDDIFKTEIKDIGDSSSPIFIPKTSSVSIDSGKKIPSLIYKPQLIQDEISKQENLSSISGKEKVSYLKKVLTPKEILSLPKTSPLNEITDLVILLTRKDVSTQIILFHLNKIYLNRFVDVSYFFKNEMENVIINLTLGELFVHTMIFKFEITPEKTILLDMFSDMIMRSSSLMFEYSILDSTKKTKKYEMKRNSCLKLELVNHYTNLGGIFKIMAKNKRVRFDIEEFNINVLIPINLHALMVKNGRYYTSIWSVFRPKESELQYSEFIAVICYIKFVALIKK